MTDRAHRPHRGRTKQQLALLFVGALVSAATVASPAYAEEYPSWADVEAARASESTKRAQVDELRSLITSTAAEVTVAQQLADTRATEFETAQLAADEAAYRAGIAAAEATEAAERSTESGQQAGQMAALLGRTTGADLTLQLLFAPDSGSALLSRLSSMDKFTERTTKLYNQADADRNTAGALSAQADVVEQERNELAEQAEQALQAAIQARAAAEEKLAAQRQNEAVMQAQLAVLTENRQATEADYQRGEAARRAAEAAARAQNGDGGANLDAGQLSNQGWARPVSGWISDSYGPRPNLPVPGVNPFHSGTDIAAGCDRPVYAATSGTVVYAGRLGTYGNWVLIDHGNGVQTGYAHNNSVYVSEGQWVPAGANIAGVGSTGASTGCHVHFEVRINGSRIDPEPFMANRGAALG